MLERLLERKRFFNWGQTPGGSFRTKVGEMFTFFNRLNNLGGSDRSKAHRCFPQVGIQSVTRVLPHPIPGRSNTHLRRPTEPLPSIWRQIPGEAQTERLHSLPRTSQEAFAAAEGFSPGEQMTTQRLFVFNAGRSREHLLQEAT